MNDVVCNYAIVRFLPYRETGEFANVGVVVYAPQTGFFEFRCETSSNSRISAFFPGFDSTIYRNGLQTIEDELKRVQTILGDKRPVEKAELPNALARFRELVRPREGLFHFGGQGVLLAADPEEGLEKIYRQFVVRHSVTDAQLKSEAATNGSDAIAGPARATKDETTSASAA